MHSKLWFDNVSTTFDLFLTIVFMNILQSIILGIIQGLTEFLPVSSSGHLELFRILLKWPTEQLAFDVVVHLGTLGAILLYFRKEVVYLFKTGIKAGRKILANPTVLGNIENFNGDRLPVLIIMGTIPVGIAAIMLGDQLSTASTNPYVIGAMLIIVGLLMWFVDKRFEVKKRIANIDFFDGLMIGASQALALIKGVSRSGATITTGRFLGYSLSDTAKYSFLLSIPAIAMAGVYEILKLIGNPGEVDWLVMLSGFVTSFACGYLSIKIFLGLLEKVGLKPFMIYRVALGVVVIVAAIVMNILNK